MAKLQVTTWLSRALSSSFSSLLVRLPYDVSYLTYPLSAGERDTVMSVSVCLYVYLSASISLELAELYVRYSPIFCSLTANYRSK